MSQNIVKGFVVKQSPIRYKVITMDKELEVVGDLGLDGGYHKKIDLGDLTVNELDATYNAVSKLASDRRSTLRLMNDCSDDCDCRCECNCDCDCNDCSDCNCQDCRCDCACDCSNDCDCSDCDCSDCDCSDCD